MYLSYSIAKRRGWAKSPGPLLSVRVNISEQWLIGRFVRVLHSKSNLINCAGVGRRTLFDLVEFFPTPIFFSLSRL
ncbi:hypothetical protein D2E16_06895 [Streptococcus suis]|nr:hypothetical protein D2E16_06895 [Streptococcus suis]